MTKGIFAVALIICLLFTVSSVVAEEDTGEERLWSALRSRNHFALLRHALAPGTGDPPEFTLGQRQTQRNLSEEGRIQAKRIGNLFRTNGIDEAGVYTSEWYRCRDTAELLELGPVRTLAALNSFFQDFGQRESMTESLQNWLSRQAMDKPLVLVTHQVNITALTGVYPSSGEIVVVERNARGELRVLGSIKTE